MKVNTLISSLLVGVGLLTVGNIGAAQAITLTFDELPFQSVDGFSYQGVTFDFKVGAVNSPNLFYNYITLAGSITYVQNASLAGFPTTNSLLTLDFDMPTSILEFGAVLSIFGDLTPGFTVELFDANLASLGIISINTTSLVSYTEGLFTYSGTPIKRAAIDFSDSAVGFALDNLTYQVVPEPFTLLGTGAAIGFATFFKRKKHSKN